MEIYRAGPEDAAEVAKARLAFLQDLRPISGDKTVEIRKRVEGYCTAALAQEKLAVLLGRVEEVTVASVFMLFEEYPPSDQVPETKRATVMNVYTHPAHRRKGYAQKLLREAEQLARDAGACVMDLVATPEGRQVYEAYGFFVRDETPMRLEL